MNRGEIILYEAADGTTAVEVRLDHDTVWLTQKQMAQLFQTERSVITKHLRNIFRTGELDEKSNVQKMHIPLSDKPVAWSRNSAPVRSGLEPIRCGVAVRRGDGVLPGGQPPGLRHHYERCRGRVCPQGRKNLTFAVRGVRKGS